MLYTLYLWSGLYASWAMTQLWSFLGAIHTLTQAKRLYGFIGGGAVVGAVLGAVIARESMNFFAPRHTLLLSSALFALSAVPTLAMTTRPPVVPQRPGQDRDADETRMTAGVGLLWENAFARRVLGIAVLSSVTLTFVDYLFKAQLAWHIHDVRTLGEKLATFYAVTNLLALFAQFVIAPWLFRTQGVQRALLFFPTGIIAASAGVVASVGSLASVYLLKGIDGALRYSLHRTSTELLLVPVPDIVRERIKPIVDLVGTRGGQAFGSLAILFLVAFGAAKPRTEGAVVLTLAIMWLVVVVTIRNLYLDVFRETLKTGGLSGKAALPELDAGAYEAIFTGLNSNRDGDVLASLDLLAEQHRRAVDPGARALPPEPRRRDARARDLQPQRSNRLHLDRRSSQRASRSGRRGGCAPRPDARRAGPRPSREAPRRRMPAGGGDGAHCPHGARMDRGRACEGEGGDVHRVRRLAIRRGARTCHPRSRRAAGRV